MYGTLISSVTVGAGGASSIAFSSIPGTYTDLVLVLSLRSNYSNAPSADFFGAQFNGDTTTANYAFRYLTGDGATVTSSTFSAAYVVAGFQDPSTYTANTFGNTLLYIPNYTAATKKSVSTDSVSENNATTAYSTIMASSWSGTSAITSISLFSANSATISQYSTAYLYGLQKGSGGATAA